MIYYCVINNCVETNHENKHKCGRYSFSKEIYFYWLFPFSYKAVKKLILERAIQCYDGCLLMRLSGAIVRFLKHHRRQSLLGPTFTEKIPSFTG